VLDIRVPQIVEANLFQVVFLQQYPKMLGYEVGPNQVAHGIHIDVFQIIPTVAIAAYLLVNALFFLQMAKQQFKGRNQRQRSTTGFCLCRILA